MASDDTRGNLFLTVSKQQRLVALAQALVEVIGGLFRASCHLDPTAKSTQAAKQNLLEEILRSSVTSADARNAAAV